MEKARYGQPGKSVKEANVDESGDYTPALQEHHLRQQDQILGPDSGKADPNRVVYFTGGGMSTGKTTALATDMAAKHPTPIAKLDIDSIKFGSKDGGFGGKPIDALPEAGLLKQSDPLGAASRLHSESSDVGKMVRQEAMRRRQSLIIDSVGGDPEDIKQQIRWFKAKGYRVEGHYVDRDLGESLQSMGERFRKTGRWVPVDVAAQGHTDAANGYHQVERYMDESSPAYRAQRLA
jgi:hypothetical protein